MTILIRYGDRYKLYDENVKKYINMTAFTLTENQMIYPFEKKYENYKKIRTCLPKDYERVKLKGFIEETSQIISYPFSELCLEDM